MIIFYISEIIFNFAFFKKWWGRYPEIMSAGKKALELLLVKEFKGRSLFDLILGMFPQCNTHALNYVLRLGAHTVTEIPNLLWSKKEQKSIPGIIVSITKEDII